MCIILDTTDNIKGTLIYYNNKKQNSQEVIYILVLSKHLSFLMIFYKTYISWKNFHMYIS